MENTKIDQYDRKILDTMGRDARISMRELASQVGLSAPTVIERVRRLEDKGIINGFDVNISPKALGYQFTAVIRLRPVPGQLANVARILQDIPQCIECDRVTGDDCFIARICLRSIDELNQLIAPLEDIAQTNTSIINETYVERRHPPF